MKYIIRILYINALLFSCTTKDGKFVGFNPQYGNILITTDNYNGARIFVDYKDTGLLTPSLLTDIPVGKRVIHVFLSTTKTSPDSVIVNIENGKEHHIIFELNKVSNGDLHINTILDSVRVYLNRLDFGMSPQHITGLPTGNYRIDLRKSNYTTINKNVNISSNSVQEINESLSVQRVVLLEHLSNTDCPPCPQSDEIVEDLIRNYGSAIVTSIGYHAFWPSNQDPMYLSGKEGNDFRILNYYQPQAIPVAWINGREVDDPLNEMDYYTIIDEEVEKNVFALLEFFNLDRSDSSLYGNLKITALEDFPANTVLYIALIEDEINYSEPPGTNGQTHFGEVFRHFYPIPAGQQIFLNKDQKYITNFNFHFKEDWGRDLTLVAFLQLEGSKEVIQSAWTRNPPL